MLNGVYTPELSVSIGKRQQFFQVGGGERQLIAGTDRRNASSTIASVLYR